MKSLSGKGMFSNNMAGSAVAFAAAITGTKNPTQLQSSSPSMETKALRWGCNVRL